MQLVPMSDPADPRLADYLHLTDSRLRSSLEAPHGLFMAESFSVIERALETGHTPRSFLILPEWRPQLERLLAAAGVDPPVYEGDSDLLRATTGFTLHRGALGAFDRRPEPSLDAVLHGARLVVVVEDVVDHTNLGAIFRSAAALGADAVLVTARCADPLYRRSIRVSMGTVFQVPWTRLGPWRQAVADLHERGFTLDAMALADDAIPLDRLPASARTALLVGTEGDGLSHGALASADRIVTIPMRHGVDSLNVAAATAVGLWEIVRHRGQGSPDGACS
ncbi:MAG: RNA methyltransferase [Pseudoclavibacter sp.]